MILLYTDLSEYIHVHTTTGHDPEEFGFFQKLVVYTQKRVVYTCIYCLFLKKTEFLRIVTSCMYMYVLVQVSI